MDTSAGFSCRVYRENEKIVRKEERIGALARVYDYTYDANGHLARVVKDGEPFEEYAYDDAGRRAASAVVRNGKPFVASYVFEREICHKNKTSYLYDESGALRMRIGKVFARAAAYGYGFDTFPHPLPGGDFAAYCARVDAMRAVKDYSRQTLDWAALPRVGYVRYEYADARPARKFRCETLAVRYVWDGAWLAEYHDLLRGLSYRFFKGKNGAPDEVEIAPGGAQSPLAGRCLLGRDQVGTVKALTREDGSVAKLMEFDSFGNMLEDSRPELFLPIGFAGGLADEDTGFVRFGARDYDPELGRFTCLDPARDMRGDRDLYD